MTEALMFFAVGFLLMLCATILFVAIRTLQTAHRYVEIAEERLEHLREEQVRILAYIDEQLRNIKEREESEGADLDVLTRLGAERSIERSKRELLGLRATRRHPGAAQERPAGDPPADAPEARKDPEESSRVEPRGGRRLPRPAGLPETRSSGAAEVPEEKEQPHPNAWRPHPDDDVRPGKTVTHQARASSGAPIRMFRVFYDRCLDSYEGYVKMAERIHSSRDEDMVPGSPAARAWEERLRRVNDGMERTLERLDILEHSNPDLASDDRISRRASIARSHSKLPKQP